MRNIVFYFLLVFANDAPGPSDILNLHNYRPTNHKEALELLEALESIPKSLPSKIRHENHESSEEGLKPLRPKFPTFPETKETSIIESPPPKISIPSYFPGSNIPTCPERVEESEKFTFDSLSFKLGMPMSYFPPIGGALFQQSSVQLSQDVGPKITPEIVEFPRFKIG
eukprot:GHVP01066064.1.p2 GENE.GHVP01066064.1~~GHVP01066064.1.p2  ORF type:complete len:169 (-),score=37.64 GHVP01066064.1:1315-1821(-)